MLRAFIDKVHHCKIQSDMSRPIQECCNYISRNLCKNLNLKDMAKEIGYTEYYLTRKFAKEMGISMSEYINTKKTELAKIWLLTTDKNMQEISDELGYGTRSYFSRVFKEKPGYPRQPAARGQKCRSSVKDYSASAGISMGKYRFLSGSRRQSSCGSRMRARR